MHLDGSEAAVDGVERSIAIGRSVRGKKDHERRHFLRLPITMRWNRVDKLLPNHLGIAGAGGDRIHHSAFDGARIDAIDPHTARSGFGSCTSRHAEHCMF
jgi:hypothetical protein